MQKLSTDSPSPKPNRNINIYNEWPITPSIHIDFDIVCVSLYTIGSTGIYGDR